ncbi:mothers against decapentaplegic homolog 6-like [Bufo bufo]|uniref:mothers against decapentaplegic homolog 6-like n=1 Tax=Bufo bufo TaxID=8384 RepID=UPI001ABE4ABF|nr:mothers against decapentaplegic homolog 6-like [Bufo bufo]XP_040268666.1 mothers against decapentaplegic homolog 6-like [Bufo bufo]XP_040268667.1 mothers against decapentaplegic homolog 6-like [Bufo bufo]
MFHSRRSLSVRQLWKQRCVTPSRGQGEGAPSHPEDLHNALRPAVHQILKKLKDEQRWQLLEAVESRGRWDCGCIWLPGEARAGKQVLPPQVLLCRLYRWPDLRTTTELKSLSHCENFWRRSGDGTSVCCNPYHFSRLAAADGGASSLYKTREFAHLAQSKVVPTEQESSRHHVRGLHDTTLSRGSMHDGHWCKLAYWEHRTRVGRLYSVTEPSVHIFYDLPKASGFCLGLLGLEPRNETVRRTQKKIGQGLVLSQEQGEVWVYNRSEHPIFINSPTLATVCARGQAVHKVLPGYSIKVFDSEKAADLSGRSDLRDGPCDTHSVRISFAKGWGACYSRQFITSCPCWLEILLSTSK